jgi:nicotinamide mononucleotide (NMN) deamidase PncC
VTGGGAEAAAQLLNVPGGSRTILEVVVPYSERSLAEFLGASPDHACSIAAARALAQRAFARAAWLAPGEVVIGIGCTASLATDRPKKGDHRFHIGVHTAGATVTHSLVLTKGARDRHGEEAVLDAVLLVAIAEAQGVPHRLQVPLLAGEEVQTERTTVESPLAALLEGRCAAVCVQPDGRWLTDAPQPRLLLPGSFNPLHEGHRRLADVAARLENAPAAFELSVTNVDKPALTDAEVTRRLRQFMWRAPVWLTRAPTFVEKARLFPGAAFVVGYDTAVRVISPAYYADCPQQMSAALAEIGRLGCRFLVAGRTNDQGCFLPAEALTFPTDWAHLFTPIPERTFRADISSTSLRGDGKCVTPASE